MLSCLAARQISGNRFHARRFAPRRVPRTFRRESYTRKIQGLANPWQSARPHPEPRLRRAGRALLASGGSEATELGKPGILLALTRQGFAESFRTLVQFP